MRWDRISFVQLLVYFCFINIFLFPVTQIWQSPFQPHGQIEAAGLVAIQGQRPPFPSGIPITLKAVIERCWIDSPQNRMSLPSVIEWLEHMHDHLSKESIMWLDKPRGHPVYNTKSGLKALPKEHKKKISVLKNTLFGKKKRNDTFDRHG